MGYIIDHVLRGHLILVFSPESPRDVGGSVIRNKLDS